MSEKHEKTENFRKQILIKKQNGIQKILQAEVEKADEFAKEYKIFLNKCKTERESINYAIETAKKNGFVEFDSNKKYKFGEKIFCVNRGKSIILAVIGKHGCKNGTNISVAHVDAPRLDLKPNPLCEEKDLAYFRTHYYGGIKKYQWTAIPLALHGIIVKKNGETLEINIGENEDDPVFCVTDLLPHLAKEQMAKTLKEAILGENLNILIGSRPFRAEKGAELVKLNIMKILNEKYGLIESDFISAELEAVPAFKARDVGFDNSLVGAYGHDDRVCAFPALMAILECQKPQKTAITILADKEEIGSYGNTGMKSAFFKYFIEDLAKMENLEARYILSNSKCLSADVNAAFDPIYANMYETHNSCHINGGAVLTKYTGSGGKGGTSDANAEFVGEIRRLLEKEKILWQTGMLGKVDSGGGGTIAKFMAELNIDVIDLGVPVLSMHAPFEVISKVDLYMVYRAIFALYLN